MRACVARTDLGELATGRSGCRGRLDLFTLPRESPRPSIESEAIRKYRRDAVTRRGYGARAIQPSHTMTTMNLPVRAPTTPESAASLQVEDPSWNC